MQPRKPLNVVLYGSPVAGRSAELAGQLGDGFVVREIDYAAPPEVKKDALGQADAMITVRFDRDVPASANLRLVQVPGVGCDEIQVDALPSGAALCNVRGHGAAVAEFVLLQMLEWCHQARAAEASFRTGDWSRSSRFGAPPHRELAGTTVGIIGFGEIGRSLAARLKGLDVRVHVANRSLQQPFEAVDEVFALHDLNRMLPQCDFVVLSLALTPRTEGIIGHSELAAMRQDTVLVNVARGPIVQEAALWRALKNNAIGGAILDVWYQYPDADHPNMTPSIYPFADLRNVLMTPHISGWTQGTVERRWRDIVDNLRRLADGRPFLNVVAAPQDK
ncbi:MAG TPA: 2-hydroxyacid dehydrogenase [Alphaproteobacteria bacterium]|nr:2-hydroxyacid dehydrogenase [Alphaproteobacteria bacterium]